MGQTHIAFRAQAKENAVKLTKEAAEALGASIGDQTGYRIGNRQQRRAKAIGLRQVLKRHKIPRKAAISISKTATRTGQ